MITDKMLYHLTKPRHITHIINMYFVFLNLYIYTKVLYKLKIFATDLNPGSLREVQPSRINCGKYLTFH